MGQTRPQVMAARQQLSSVLPGARPLPLHPLLPFSLTQAPLTLSLAHSLRSSTIKWPRQQRAFSLPKCQFLGNRAGTRAITAGCQLNANKQDPHTYTHSCMYCSHVNHQYGQLVQALVATDCWWPAGRHTLPCLVLIQEHINFSPQALFRTRKCLDTFKSASTWQFPKSQSVALKKASCCCTML